MENSLNDIKIKSNKLSLLCECVICSDFFNSCTITKCGHSFCEECILSCINLKNKCPTCNTPLTKENIAKDYVVDNIIAYIKEERAQEEYKNIENSYKLVENSVEMNRVQKLFFESLKKVFGYYNSYFEKLEKAHQNQTTEIKNFLNDQHQTPQKIQECTSRLKELNETHCKVMQGVENSLSSYLSNLPESPLSLPMKAKIVIEKTNYEIPNLVFSPTSKSSILYETVEKYMTTKGDAILSYAEDHHFVIRRTRIVTDINKMLCDHVEEIKIDTNNIFLNIGLQPNETIVLKGGLNLSSEAPKTCLTYNFDPRRLTLETYFSCADCGLKWICSECMKICHDNHSVKLFKTDHEVTWACCYCLKKNCCLKNKNSK